MVLYFPVIPIRRLRILPLYLLLFFCLFLPFSAKAEDSGKTVRVGWYESSFNFIDASGRRSGYAYEYQQKLAAYTGWHYEYVNASWSVLIQMLADGEIDLLSDVSYSEERTRSMLFPSLPMGTEEYYLFISPENRDILPEDFSTLNGKKIGVNQGSIQTGIYLEWAKRQDIHADLIPLACPEEEALSMLINREIDVYVAVDSITDPNGAVPICKIGSSDYYFAVNKDRPDLLEDLNQAMSRIQDENRYYNQRMFDKYFQKNGTNAFLSTDEIEWLSSHGPIRVGYQDNYLAFCAADEKTGALTGALKDYLSYASGCMVNGTLDFHPIAYHTSAAAMDALQKGEVDCVFPVSLSSYDAERLHSVITGPVTRTDVYAVVRQTDKTVFAEKSHVIAAVSEGDLNNEIFLLEHFPDWKKIYYSTTEECLQAVADNVADCVLISYYRYNNIARLCEKNYLTILSTGDGVDYAFAVSNDNTELYSVLSKAAGRVPASIFNTAVSYYIAEDARLTIKDFIIDNLAVLMLLTLAVVLIIFSFMIRSIRAEKTAKKLISATESDELTGLYNRNFFFQYADRMYRESPETPRDAVVLDIEQFHSVNALNGRIFGDRVLYTLGKAIQEIAVETRGIAGRFQADRFDIYCLHLEDYQTVYERLQKKLDEMTPNISLRLRIGVMPWQKGMDPAQMFERANIACSMARGHFNHHLMVFDDNAARREIYEQRLLNDLRGALDAHEFVVYYQPKFNIQCDPPVLASAEALVRWKHHELGMIRPDDFIPLLERNGKIRDVDQYVWEEAASQITRWKEKYGFTLPVSVNLSRVDVFDAALERNLDAILHAYRLAPGDLKLEVTESAYTENSEQVILVIKALRKKGYEVEMDDFGSGYSSLNMLSSMPVDVLKMDQAFIRKIELDEKDAQLVALILDIAKSLKIPVIAEGVETEEQLQLLKNLGCALVQGYYFSRPLPPDEFETAFLRGVSGDGSH